ncbi:MAG: LytTR family DNA-binding domain-containing protein [Bacteroidetes bacterium]|nr:LytTR family DNA-binding domain-containing protein [Bacteroidota bacterium]MBU1373073.1 LytTR family DNA-binding domain-containing protein [Bacteroidota bacterium]MBU1484254.1 LytTR family DNA-binding domain-containing protein [Bacteroidota bacterium]MBU1759953.1 LytTR family DNA-binding domain-containing protein [Bacteroidota bacterium]MBU2268222.1 LytTR family DNA-binding domain-containing protein [Bacteroidota bacterium]
MVINCIVVDDEPLAIDIINDYIDKIPFLQLVKSFQNPIEALTIVQEGGVDLVFLDVQMPELTGIQFLKIANNKCRVILTTAYPQYAVEGYEHNVVDYLLKPIAFDRFYKAAEKVQWLMGLAPQSTQEIQAPVLVAQPIANDFIFVKTEYKIQKIYLNDILFIEGLKDYVSIYTETERIITLQSMKKIDEGLPDHRFVRVHKSYIVALDKIESIERSRISIADKIIPIGDTHRDCFFKMIEDKNI